MDVLTEKSFLLYCAKHYDNPQCHSTDEFVEDIRRIKYIKKLITRYIDKGELKERLILNHFIVLSNVFNPETLCRVIFLKMETQMNYVKPFLIMLGVLTEHILNVKSERNIDTNLIPMDQGIIDALRKIEAS